MYLPKSKYKGNQFTSGQEYIIPGEVDAYVGPYFTTFTGAVYTGAEPSRASVRLQPLPEKENPTGFTSATGEVIFYEDYDLIRNNADEFQLRSTFPVPSYYPKPTEKDYEKGNLKRYFVKDKQTGRIQEVTSAVYRAIKTKTSEYYYPKYLITELSWSLTSIQDNRYTTTFQAFTLTGLEEYLNNPAQFVK
jgi:hypothetical protein